MGFLTLRSSFFLNVLLPPFATAMDARALNASILNPLDKSLSLSTSTPICTDSLHARELDLERVNYRDCIPLLNEILLDPNINDRNQYSGKTAYQSHLYHTCSITLLPQSVDGDDTFWGYQIAIAAATAIKQCVEESVDQYGGTEFTTSSQLFYAQVKNLGDGGKEEANVWATSLETSPIEDMLLPTNDIDTALLVPNPSTTTPTCQISKSQYQFLRPVRTLDCYHLFYNILTDPTVERRVVLRGLSPLRYERYGTCTLQLRGFSAIAADKIAYVALLLAAVSIVQRCMVESALVLGGAISVGTRGQYFVRIFNSIGTDTRGVVRSE